MPSYLISPTAPSAWRVDVEALDRWLSDRWGHVAREGDGTGQRAHLWTLPDLSDVWVPEDLEVVWTSGLTDVLAAVGAWCASQSPDPLILTDDGYNYPIDLASLDEAGVTAALDALDE